MFVEFYDFLCFNFTLRNRNDLIIFMRQTHESRQKSDEIIWKQMDIIIIILKSRSLEVAYNFVDTVFRTTKILKFTDSFLLTMLFPQRITN